MIEFLTTSIVGLVCAVLGGIILIMVACKLFGLVWALMQDIAGIIFAVIVFAALLVVVVVVL